MTESSTGAGTRGRVSSRITSNGKREIAMESRIKQEEMKLTVGEQPSAQEVKSAGGMTRRDFLEISAQTSAAFIVGCLFNGKIEALQAGNRRRNFPWMP